MKKHHRLLREAMLLMLAMVCGSLWAQAPSGYYDSATDKTGTELRQALHDIIDNHTTISYGQIWNAFWSTDNKGNGVVWDMYSDVPGGTPPYTFMMGDNQCGNYSGEGGCYNREHSWPKSWFSGGEDGVPGRDLHHIFPTDGYVNAQRSNHPYGEVGNASWTSQNGSKLGSCRTPGYSGTVFEPIDEYKGDFARAYFYMSTRYYGEDSDWGHSDMTNKAEIESWAMTMLLRWSDNDPVSQKEIDRNNAIYNDYQHNRNPFIDHPEFAHLIWDDDYQGGVAYNITCATNLQNGSISAPSSAVEGFTVNLYAYPAVGYMVNTWYVWRTDDPYTTLTVTNNSFIMPAFDVTVSATFVQNTTPYAITCLTGLSHGSITVSANSAMSGTNVELSNTPETGWSLYSYYVYKTGDINTIVYAGKGNSFVMPAFDVTVSASFAQGSGGSGNYEKVTSAPASWSGEYLIVYETGNKAFNGALTDLDDTPNTISVTISNNTIEANATTNAAKFTIATMSGGYSIKAESGKYIGITSNSNGLTSSDSPLSNTISYNNGDVDIVSSGGAYLRYNAASNQQKFRYFKSSTYSNQKAIQLYKKTEGSTSIPTHKVHFYGNGGVGTMSDQTVDEFVPTPLNSNAFTREGYAFVGWNTAPNGSGITYSDGASVTLLQDLMLYAQWDYAYAIACLIVEHGTISTSVTEASEGTVVTLIATPNSGYELDYWEVIDANNELVEVTNNQFEMPGSNVTVSAGFAYVGTAYQQKYYLVTSTDQLVEGRTYLIVNTDAGKAMGPQSGDDQDGNNRVAVAVDISNGSISSIESTVCELTLGTSNGHWTFFDANWRSSGGYLYASSGSANQLKTRAANNDPNGEWSISIETDGTATIVAQGDKTRNHLRYNYSSSLFACYASNNANQPKVELYVRSEEYEHLTSTTLAQLFTYDKNTIHNGATLTANQIVGKDLCNRAGHLIIEEGAQFKHDETGINALVKKAVAAYSGTGGWYTISMPFTALDPDEVENMTASAYDLYAYNEAGNDNGKEWINHKSNGGFNLSPSAGYLYAHNPAITLRMEGTLNVGTYSETVNLSYSNDDVNLKGFNLLGNPVAHEISFTKTAEVSDGYYYLANSGDWVYETGNTVPVGRGFMVKANATNQSVTLNPQNKGCGDEKGQYLCLSVGDEKAYVKLNEGVSMPLLSLRGANASLYLTRGSQPYVMLTRDGATFVDLCYETHGNATQTLTVDLQGNKLDYLHLIDHKTGADVDLLSTPSYAFETGVGGYATRFRLVFGPSTGSGTEGSTSFAYYADGEIRFVEACQGATLQIVDATGRVVASVGDVSGNVSTNGMTPGVYVLRLVTDDDIRVQKIVVK